MDDNITQIQDYTFKPEDYQRFWTKVEIVDTNCWEWLGSCAGNGYGQVYMSNKHWKTHRLSYLFYYGYLDSELTIDHLCRNKKCVNPTHLELVTQRINNLRSDNITAINSRKTHCKRGHEFNETNTRIWKGGRFCRKCVRLHGRNHYRKNRELILMRRGK